MKSAAAVIGVLLEASIDDWWCVGFSSAVWGNDTSSDAMGDQNRLRSARTSPR